MLRHNQCDVSGGNGKHQDSNIRLEPRWLKEEGGHVKGRSVEMGCHGLCRNELLIGYFLLPVFYLVQLDTEELGPHLGTTQIGLNTARVSWNTSRPDEAS